MANHSEALLFRDILAVEIPRTVFGGANAVEIESVLNRLPNDVPKCKYVL